MTSLVGEIRDAVRDDATVAVIPSVARPTGGAWYEGTDLAALAKITGVIEACFYEPSVARIRADIFDVKRRMGETGTTAGHPAPRMAGSAEPGRCRRCSCRAAGSRDQRHRLLQLRTPQAKQPRLDCGRRSPRSESRRAVQGKGRRGNGRCRRDRPGALPPFRRGGGGHSRTRSQPGGHQLCRRASQGRDRGRSRRGRHRRRGRREGCFRPDRGLARPRRHPDQQRRRLEQSEPGRNHSGGVCRRRQCQRQWRLQLLLRGACLE